MGKKIVTDSHTYNVHKNIYYTLQYGVGEELGVEGNEGNGGSGNLRLESVVRHLREIVGPQVPRSTLVEITLAADYDLNRALNFFYK